MGGKIVKLGVPHWHFCSVFFAQIAKGLGIAAAAAACLEDFTGSCYRTGSLNVVRVSHSQVSS